MIRRTPDYGVESASQEERLISGKVLTAALAIATLSVTALLYADAQEDSPSPSVPLSTSVENPDNN